ncbi:MAG: helicase-related protein, partial [Rhodovarius sp.]|nr:helicase-related protein [Rhodovarius sp.]
HVFTDRLLNARGMVETMFMGAETIRPLLMRLIPQVEIETRPRLSQLTHTGFLKLGRLPPRTAVVAFSAGEVYAIAEAIRSRRGGCAVVMGRLSPRTRNAQVALYQNREVDFLVATDAIGMGLNMDVDHVAFASLVKFDGHAPRLLTAQEAAQIAGRAGRGMRDGTFGSTGDCPPLPEEMVARIQDHQFEPLQAIAWRNSDLDFTSIDALLDSLAAPPPAPGLTKGHDATDHITLHMLSRDPEIRRLAHGSSARVRLLWEACSVPDFRKLADDSHTRLCGRIFRHLVEDGHLPEDWIAQQISQTSSTEGDIDTLMARLAAIRTWSYVAARADWLRDAAAFQQQARAAEDALSDALHERLTQRFVDRRAAHLIRRLDPANEEELLSAVTRQGEVIVEGHLVGRVEGFLFHPDATAEDEETRRLVLRAARRALREEMPRRVAALEIARAEAFSLTPDHKLRWEGAEVARLRAGPEPGKPLIEVLPSEFLDGAQRERIRARLSAWIDGVLARDLAAIAAVEKKAEDDNTLRGPAFQLRETLGIRPGPARAQIPAEVQAKLKTIGARAGRFALYVPDALKPRAMAMRAQLWALSRNIPTPPLPPPGLVAIPTDGPLMAAWPPGFAEDMGWVPAGPVALRLDVAERIAGELAYATRQGPVPFAPELLARYGIKAQHFAAVLAALGFRLIEPEPLPEGMFGPPAPVCIGRARPERPRRDRPARPAEAAAAEASTAAEGEASAAARAQRHRRRQRPPRPAEAAPAEEAAAPARGSDRAGEAGRGQRPDKRAEKRGENGRPEPRQAGSRPERREERARSPWPDRGGETRVFHQDKVTISAEDSPFAKLAALKLK